jgi:nucleoid-associated protein YgaU
MKDPALLEIPEEHVLAAFAAMMLGSSPLDPPPEAAAMAAMAARLAEPRPARRPGDVEGTRAFRSVYALARGQAAGTRSNGHHAERDEATKSSIVLGSTLELRHRQRAALALRYVFGLPASGVARVLGLSKNRAAEVARAGATNVSKAVGGRVDVARHLRAIGATVRSNGMPVAPSEKGTEPRSVVKLLLSSVAEAPAGRGRITTPAAAPRPRPVYRVRHAALPASRPPAVPHAPALKPRRTGLLVAACVAALTFLGAFAPVALLRPAARVPLAAVPIAPVVEGARSAPVSPVLPIGYRVREGDTLWSIAGTVLGDASRWSELWRSNAGTLMSDGSRFLDPDLIRPGWRLRLPPR